MKRVIITYLILAVSLIFSRLHIEAPAQESVNDSLFFMQQIKDFIQKNQYATAHLLLEERIQKFGMKTSYICMIVQNGIDHYFDHENYDIFYLKDQKSVNQKQQKQKKEEPRIVRLRYPQHLLEKVINRDPTNAYSYKLLGDYYDIQLNDLNNFEFIQAKEVKLLEEKIFKFYFQAQELGYQDPYVNRWLGDYYAKNNNIDLAENQYLKNIKSDIEDPISYFRLAELNYLKKQYTQAYNYAKKSLKYFAKPDIYLRYDALRVAGNSLRELGEHEEFLKYMQEAIQLQPDLQNAYIDLAEFFHQQHDSTKVESTLEKMLLENPFDMKGYRVLENYIIDTGHYAFADSLFASMILKYDNWDEALANIYWSRGNIAYYNDDLNDAKNFWEISRNYMKKYLPENHQLIKKIGDIEQP